MNGGKLTLGGPSATTPLLNVDGTFGFGGSQCVNAGGSHLATGSGTVNVIAGPVAPATFVNTASGYCTAF